MSSKATTRTSIGFMQISISCNGKTSGGSASYERIEHADGTVTERRSSEAIPANASISDVIAGVFAAAFGGEPEPKPVRRLTKTVKAKVIKPKGTQ